MSQVTSRGFASVLTAQVGAVVWFALSTALYARVPRALPLALGLALALGLVLLSGHSLKPAGSQPRWWWLAACGGAVAFWAAPALAAAQRATDAPSGSVSMLLMTVVPGVFVVLGSYALRVDRPSRVAWASALAAAAGAAGLLANWERPSSFVPFVRFPERELLMVLAGVLFAVGVLVIHYARARSGNDLSAPAVAGAAVAALLLSIPSLTQALPALSASGPALLLAAVSYAAFVSGWLASGESFGMARSASILLAAPVGFMLLTLVERATGLQGPNPIVWKGALAGAALGAVGAAVVALAPSPVNGRTAAWKNPLLVAGALSAGFALATLALPAIRQTSEGVTTSGDLFRVTWDVLGFQSGVGLATAAAGLCALAATLAWVRGEAAVAWIGAACTCLVAAAAALFLGESSLSTWVDFVPTEIQHAYGTEYARLTVEASVHPVRIASLVVSVLVALATVFADRIPGVQRDIKEIDTWAE